MNKINGFLILFFLITAVAILFADEQSQKDFLPIGLTEEEIQRLDEIGITHQTTIPPEGVIRNPAEWEPSEGVIIRWPLGISISLIAELSEDVMVTTLVGSSYEENQARNAYSSGGVNMDNTQFIIAPTNSIWTRDYGPWFIFQDNNLAIVDHIYNRPRPLDDVIPQRIGEEWNLDVYGMDLIHTGGNHMSDGLGMSMSTQLVYNENPDKTPAEVDSIMMAYLGNDYTVLGYIESGGIHHIDCWAKFLNPTTILIKDVSPGNPSYHLLNARAEYLSQQISAWGQPYTIVRVYCPYGTAYTNSLILNGKVFVPTFDNSYDAIALQVYREAMPGYEVLGFDGSWYDNDAIHCRTMGVPDHGMLFIHHIPLIRVSDTSSCYLVSAMIIAYSDSSFITDSLKIYYSINEGSWEYTYLNTSPQPDSCFGYIPAQHQGSQISYYLKAADNSGRVETHPYIGEPWAHIFTVNIPPQIISADSFSCQAGDYFAYSPEFIDDDDSVHIISYSNYPVWLSVQNDSLVGTAPDSQFVTGFSVEVADEYSSDNQDITLVVYASGLCDYIPGDINGDENVMGNDITYGVRYFKGIGDPPPDSCWNDSDESWLYSGGDVNGNCQFTGSDITFLVAFFKGYNPEILWCPHTPPAGMVIIGRKKNVN
ncbi:MAG: hypothetical protein DRP26_05210 [Candidatus Zixiibacteriota bacterium]|nr:MAG: hypothetical protein DRP26_05210 [candidate division Zixibacteria bacterium]